MILLFLGSWRSTLIIAVSIPLSILTSIIVLERAARNHQHHDAGRPGAGGRHPGGRRHRDHRKHRAQSWTQGKDSAAGHSGRRGADRRAGAGLHAVHLHRLSADVLLSGVARYLFVPLAEAVVFAMLASLHSVANAGADHGHVPAEGTKSHDAVSAAESSARAPARFRARLRSAPAGLSDLLLGAACTAARSSCRVLPGSARAAFLLVPWLGQDFFPGTDSGQFILHVRAQTGTRIEETARLCDLVEDSIRERDSCRRSRHHSRQHRPAVQPASISCYSTSGSIGAGDADILVSLEAEAITPPPITCARCARRCRDDFPASLSISCRPTSSPRSSISACPRRIDIQIEGADLEGNRQVADRFSTSCGACPGIVDLRIQQIFDYPKLHVDVDRTKALQGGFTQRDVASSLLISLSGSFQTDAHVLLEPANGVNYNLVDADAAVRHSIPPGPAEHSHYFGTAMKRPGDSGGRRRPSRRSNEMAVI